MPRIFAGRVAVLLVSGCLSTFAGATAQRTFVRSDGVDNPSCSLAAPCRQFAAAVAATSDGGEVIVLDSAGYGAVTITRSVSIIAPAGVYAGISVFSGDGITVNAPSGKVVLSGLTINGLGGSSGVVVQAAETLRIERCTIFNMNLNGVQTSVSGINVHVSDSLIAGNGASGIAPSGAALLEVDRTRLERNGTVGILSFNVRAVYVRDSMLLKQGTRGIEVVATFNTQVDVTLERVTVAENGGGGVYVHPSTGGNAAIAITHCSFVRNALVNLEPAILLEAVSPAAARASIEHTIIQRNRGDGVVAEFNGSNVTVSNSTLVSNDGFAFIGQGAYFYTRQNNTIRGNNLVESFPQNFGTITNLPGE